MAYRAPVIENILRQHAEQAAHLWNVYDFNLLNPEDNEEMDEERMARLVERLDAHIDGLRVAGVDGLRVAEERYAEFPEAGELFVVRMLQPGAEGLLVGELEIEKVRGYLSSNLNCT
jgi:hypothetical protein